MKKVRFLLLGAMVTMFTGCQNRSGGTRVG